MSEKPPKKRSRLGGFLSHMTAGLLGGALGVAGALFGLDRLPPFNQAGGAPGAPSASAGDPALRRDIDTLKSDFDQSTKALGERLAKIEAGAGDGQGPSAELTGRIEQLESGLAALKTAGTGEGPDGGEAAASADIEALKAGDEAAKAQVEALAQDLAKLRQEIGQAAPGQAGAPVASEKLEARMADLEAQLGTLDKRQAATAKDGKLAARAVAIGALARAATSGEAYAAQLDTVKSLTKGEGAPDFGVLEKHAMTGIMSVNELVDGFADYRRAALDAAAAPKTDALLDQISSRARSLVRVRPSGPQEGSGPAAVLSRVEAHLKARDLAKAADEARALEGGAAQAMQPWTKAAGDRLAIDRDVENLRRSMLGQIANFAPAGDG